MNRRELLKKLAIAPLAAIPIAAVAVDKKKITSAPKSYKLIKYRDTEYEFHSDS